MHDRVFHGETPAWIGLGTDAKTTTTFNKVAASVEDVQCTVATENPFGQVVAGHLVIRAGIMTPVVHQARSLTAETWRVEDFRGTALIGRLSPDDISEMQNIKVVYCFWLFDSGKGDRRTVPGNTSGLALLPVPHTPATYRRVGHIDHLDVAQFAEAKFTRFRIIQRYTSGTLTL